MSWVERFYSTTGEWWGKAESGIDDEDRWRAAVVAEFVQPPGPVLELGCGYGSTARAIAQAGFNITGIDISDRIEIARRTADVGGPIFLRGDFYEAQFDTRFAAVCYWDGFGVGTDADQRRLLRRVAEEWLAPNGIALIEVFNPSWWERQDGFEETKHARPDDGYEYSLGHRRTFDAATGRAQDIWWKLGTAERLTQSLRCYSPSEFASLVEGILAVVELRAVGSEDGGPAGDRPSYLAVLRNSDVTHAVPTPAD